MSKLERIFLTISIIYLAACLVCFPKAGVAVAKDAVLLCINSVVPALLPYLVCSGYLSASGFASRLGSRLSPIMRPLFNIPGSGAIALVLGTVSGYPIGAVCAADLYSSGECTKPQAERLLAFCNNSGPLFIMSVVGAGYLDSPHLGRLLYISHILSALLVGIIMRTYNPKGGFTQKALPRHPAADTKNIMQIFGTVIDNSVFSILKICGFVVFFTVLAQSIPKTSLSPYFHAILEITGGTKAIVASPLGFELKMSIISFFIALSGISVLFQVGSIASVHGLSLKPYVIGKLLQGIFSALFTRIMVSKLPQTVDVFAPSRVPVTTISQSLAAAGFMLVFGLVVLLILACSVRLFQKFR